MVDATLNDVVKELKQIKKILKGGDFAKDAIDKDIVEQAKMADTLTLAAIFTGAVTFLWTIYQQHQINNMCYSCPFRTDLRTFEKTQPVPEIKK